MGTVRFLINEAQADVRLKMEMISGMYVTFANEGNFTLSIAFSAIPIEGNLL